MSLPAKNLLQTAKSPYLRQHKANPVHWRVWGQDALAEAQEQNKPILLSIGYAACHWCHVMARESFANKDIATLMNQLFVNIKVDREERPDIDEIYMRATQQLGMQGGWPLTLFCTPEAVPFGGGTYFPPTARGGQPAFPDILKRGAAFYHSNEAALKTAKQNRLIAAVAPPQAQPPLPDLPQRTASALAEHFDENGGLRGAPKFPQFLILELLWRVGSNNKLPALQQKVQTTMQHICQSGIWDQLGGGVCRYSVDSQWLVPHFEKNALR